MVPGARPSDSEGVSGATFKTLDKGGNRSGCSRLGGRQKRGSGWGSCTARSYPAQLVLQTPNSAPPDGVTGADTATLALELFGESAAGVAMLDPLEREGGIDGVQH